MLRRAAYGYAGALATLLLLVFALPDSFYDAPALIGPPLGYMAGVAFADRKRGLPPWVVLVRTSLAVVVYFGAGIGMAAACAAGERTRGLWLSTFLGLPREEWLPWALLAFAGPPLGSVASEIISSTSRLRWLGRIVEVATCGCGLLTAAWLAGQALGVFCFVTLGPLSEAGARIASAAGALTPLHPPSYPLLSLLGLSTILAGGFLVVRVGPRFDNRVGVIILEIAVALVLLGSSYRLTALVAIIAALALELVIHSRRHTLVLRWLAAPAIVILSLAPVDVSFQSLPGSPHFAPTIQGLLTRSVTDIARNGPSVVVGGCTSIYFAPRWVWVW